MRVVLTVGEIQLGKKTYDSIGKRSFTGCYLHWLIPCKKYNRYRYKNVCLHYFVFQLNKHLFWLFSKLDFDIFGSSSINDGLFLRGLMFTISFLSRGFLKLKTCLRRRVYISAKRLRLLKKSLQYLARPTRQETIL